MNRGYRILVVDDDPLNLSIMEEILSDEYELVMAASGEECLQLAQETQPDLVLLDIMLPGIDGYETCRRLREDSQLRFVKVVLVSAKTQLEERLEGYDSQADDYITKPFDADELRAKVRVMLRLQYVEEIEEFKGQFLDILAHETRTPLTGILSPAQILHDSDEMDATGRKEMAAMILNGAHSLHHLVKAIVELCAFKAGRVALSQDPVDLITLVGTLVGDLESHARKKSMTLELESSACSQVRGDRERLEHVLRILLENAITHGDQGSRVDIRCSESSRGVVVEVENRGDIVAEQQLPNVFEAFRDHDVDHYSGGVGIDLALAREIAFAHGGNLECRVASPGSMAFRLTLPAFDPDTAEDQIGQQILHTVQS